MTDSIARCEAEKKRKTDGYFHVLQAGRGVASLGVLLFHSLDSYPKGALSFPLRIVNGGGQWGWLGVHGFFAISGWCIAERVAKGRRTGERGIHFVAERFLRIYPTYWAVFIIAILIRCAAVPFNTAHLLDGVPHDGVGWFSSIFLVEPYFGRSSFLMVSWSLVYEIGFYMCAALALVAVPRRSGGGTVLFTVGTLICILPSGPNHPQMLWRIFELWPNFFAGVAAWWAARRGARISGYGVLVLLLAAAVAMPEYGGLARLTAIGTAWVLALTWKWNDYLAKLAIMRPLVWMGGISYSLYLIHVPLISPFENLMVRKVPYASHSFIAIWACAIAFALIGAKFLNVFVEVPFERWRRRLT